MGCVFTPIVVHGAVLGICNDAAPPVTCTDCEPNAGAIASNRIPVRRNLITLPWLLLSIITPPLVRQPAAARTPERRHGATPANSVIGTGPKSLGDTATFKDEPLPPFP